MLKNYFLFLMVKLCLCGCSNLAKRDVPKEGVVNSIISPNNYCDKKTEREINLNDMKVSFYGGFIGYFVVMILISIAIRCVLSLFKYWGVKNGEAGDIYTLWGGWETYWKIFLSNAKTLDINDFWLPSLIGTIELVVYPFIIKAKLWYIIGAWLTIKTAVHWGKWSETRTPYNRYLFANASVLFISYWFSMRFIVIK